MDMTQNTILENTFLGSKWFDPNYLFSKGVAFFHSLSNLSINNGSQVISIYRGLLIFFALFFITLIIYCTIRVFEIRRKEHHHLEHEIEEYAHKQKEHEKKLKEKEGGSKNERWVKTLSYLFSQHSSDWKLAIIEADTMLESLMEQLGFKGESLGDKLKSATQENFRGLPLAWEAHTIRNRIAHEGTSFELSQREAKRVTAIYEQIFREFDYI